MEGVLGLGQCEHRPFQWPSVSLVTWGTLQIRIRFVRQKGDPSLEQTNKNNILVITLPLLLFLQVFLLTVVFGLFHGVVFFPVLLSLCGPDNDNALNNGQVGQTSAAAAASVEAAGEDPSSAAPTATTAIEVSHIGYIWFMITQHSTKHEITSHGFLLIRLDE